MSVDLASQFACCLGMTALDCASSVPHSQMIEPFLSLSEAQKYTGKSRNSLRRFVEGITKPDNHSDRHLIQPTPEQVAELHKNNSPFSWKVSAALLDREFRKQEGSQPTQSSASDSSSAAIELLQETIRIVKAELDEKNRQIAQFQERDRETNILLQQTTEKLVMLTEGRKLPKSNASDAVTVDSDRGQGSDDWTPSNDQKKKSFWQRLNRPLFSGK